MAPGIASNFLTGSATLRLVRDGQLTVAQVAEDHLRRYDERDATIHAWKVLDKERVRQEAARLDATPVDKRGPLHGLVLGVKDVFYTRDMPTEFGSVIYEGNEDRVDAASVAILRHLGALVYGKTHTAEFATTKVGPPTTNPFNPNHTPGGSSSGSAAAVSDWQCHVAIGTQTVGSIIRPATFTGIFGFQANVCSGILPSIRAQLTTCSWGAVSPQGLKFGSISLDTLGVFGRSIEDIQLVSQALGVRDDVPPPVRPKPLSECRFAYVRTDQWEEEGTVLEELRYAWGASRRRLAQAGAHVDEIILPPAFDFASGQYHTKVMAGEGRSMFLTEYTTSKPQLHPMLLDWVEQRTSPSRKEQIAAYDHIASLRPVIDGIAGRYDALIAASAPGEAPFGIENTGDNRHCGMWTALHVPCVNVPGFMGPNGLPVGLTLIAPRYEDERLLSVASEVAKVWVGMERQLGQPPAPEGVKHLST